MPIFLQKNIKIGTIIFFGKIGKKTVTQPQLTASIKLFGPPLQEDRTGWVARRTFAVRRIFLIVTDCQHLATEIFQVFLVGFTQKAPVF
jgi:hypothetical protein